MESTPSKSRIHSLARHFTDGRLDSGEYDERVRRAYASVYLDELPPLFSDLPAEQTSLDGYDRAWQQGHGLVDRSAFPGYRGARRAFKACDAWRCSRCSQWCCCGS